MRQIATFFFLGLERLLSNFNRLVQLYARRVWEQRSPMLIIASLSWITATGLFFSVLPRLTGCVRNAPSYQDIQARVRYDGNEGKDHLDGLDLSVDEMVDVSELDGDE